MSPRFSSKRRGTITQHAKEVNHARRCNVLNLLSINLQLVILTKILLTLILSTLKPLFSDKMETVTENINIVYITEPMNSLPPSVVC